MIKFIIIYLYISCVLSIIDICECWDDLLLRIEKSDINEYPNWLILMISITAILGELLFIIPMTVYDKVKKLGS